MATRAMTAAAFAQEALRRAAPELATKACEAEAGGRRGPKPLSGPICALGGLRWRHRSPHRSRRVRFGLGAVVALVSTLSACSDSGGSSPPTSPSPPAGSSLTGTWKGAASDSSGPGQITWQITQSGQSLTGSLTMIDAATNLTGRGSVTGTVSGSSLSFTMSIPAGGFDAPHTSCTAQASGEAQHSSSSLTGSYSGSNSCAGPIASGQLTLDKQ